MTRGEGFSISFVALSVKSLIQTSAKIEEKKLCEPCLPSQVTGLRYILDHHPANSIKGWGLLWADRLRPNKQLLALAPVEVCAVHYFMWDDSI